MLRPYFCVNSRWEEFSQELESWLGTPYRHYQKTKGYGADCTMFVAACYQKQGILKGIDYEYYSKDWHLHTDNPIVEDGITLNFDKNAGDGLRFLRVFPSEHWVRGDLLLFWTVKPTLTNHCAVLWPDGEKMIHSINHAGVEFTQYFRWWKRHTRYILRIYEEV